MDPILIPIVALLIPIIVAPTALGVKFARTARQLEHVERMRALELGRNLTDDEPWSSPAMIALAIGVAVPLGSLGIAWLASETLGTAVPIWAAAGTVGLGGVIGGTILALQHLAARNQVAPSFRDDRKPALAPDAYDFVGSRD